jgi:hypothetical protein
MILPLLYASVMAAIDVVSLGTVKYVWATPLSYLSAVSAMALAIGLYALQPILFYQALSFEGMAVANLSWNVLSSMLVTMIGLVIFKERLTRMKAVGAMFSILAIGLLTWEDGV